MNPLHYPSLELCKKLTEIWFPDTLLSNGSWWIDSIPYSTYAKWETSRTVCPSVMEMLDVIPWWIETEDWVCNLVLRKERWWENWYYDKNWSAMIFNDTLPNTLAKMILWLVEDKYLTFNNEK